MKFIKKLDNRLKLYYFENNMKITIEEMSERIFAILNKSLKIIGYDLYADISALLNIRFVSVMIFLGLISFSFGYSFYTFRNDFQNFIFMAIMFGALIQIYGKALGFLFGQKSLMEVIELCKSMIKFAENVMMKKCFEKWFLRCFHIGLLMTVFFSVLSVFLISSPAIIYVSLNVKTTIFGFILPYCNNDTIQGYMIHLIFHSSSATVGCLVFCGTLTYINDLLFHYLAFFESLNVLVDQLQELINSKKSIENDEEIKRILAKLIEGHNLSFEFLKAFESAYKIYHLIEIGGSMLGTCVGVFAMRKV
jgi:hypothetical protein